MRRIMLGLLGILVIAAIFVTGKPRVLASDMFTERSAYFREQAAGRAFTTEQQAQNNTASWTFIVFMAADNDLEKFAMADMDEMEFVGSTADVNIVVQIDRAEGFDSSNGDWTDTRRYFIDNDFDPGIRSTLVDSVGETNSGDPATLSDFASWAIRTYPAQHYALVIWDHGGSWLGVAIDGSAPNYDGLTMPELKDSLSATVTTTDIERFDLIGFDACLMGAFEVYGSIAPYADYAVGSPELIPGFGWDYAGALLALIADPTIDATTFGQHIVDSFITFYSENVTSYTTFNLALVDLSRLPDVITSLEALSTAVEAADALTTLDALLKARENTLVYGAYDDPRLSDLWSAADLIQFLTTFSQQIDDETISDAANQVIVMVRTMLVYYRSNTPDSSDTGLSIYFPRNSAIYRTGDFAQRYEGETPEGLSFWREFLSHFFSQSVDEQLDNPLLELAQSGLLNQYEFSFSGLGVNRAAFVVLYEAAPDHRILIDYDRLSLAQAGRGQQFVWAQRLPVIGDGAQEIPILLVTNRSGPGTGIVNGLYVPQDGGDPVEAMLFFTLSADGESGTATSAWGIRMTAVGPMAYEIDTQPGDRFHPYWLSLDANNNFLTGQAFGTLTFGGDPFYYRLIDAPPGSYDVELLVENSGGITVSEDLPLTSAPQEIATPESITAQECAIRGDWMGTHTFQYGDTLWAIAYSYNMTVDTLVQANCIEDINRVGAGYVLIVPFNPTATPEPPTPIPPVPQPVGGDFFISLSPNVITTMCGQSADYFIIVQNNGPDTALGVSASITYNPAEFPSLGPGSPSQGSVAATTGFVQWTVGDIPAGGSATLQIFSIVNIGTPGAYYQYGSSVSGNDPNSGNNSAVLTVNCV